MSEHGVGADGMVIEGREADPKVARDKNLHIGKPRWLKTKIPTGATYFAIKKDLRDRKLHTVCEEAKCPNIGTCWNLNTATFMVLGDTCTRACRFCNVKTGNPAGLLDPNEPLQTAESALQMKLKYAVITMVDRDDLPDGGALHVAKVIRETKRLNPGIRVEILAGDWQGRREPLAEVLEAGPEVYAHNLETVETLTPRVRDARASYRQSLASLELAKELRPESVTKSALMLGLGEHEDDVETALRDLRNVGVDIITLGQYMRPTKKHLTIKRWVPPEEFEQWKVRALALGFRGVASGPLVRSSYRAGELYDATFPDQPS